MDWSTMTSKKKSAGRRRTRTTPRDEGVKVSLEFGSKVVLDSSVVRGQKGQSLQNAIAYYRTELEGNPDKVFSVYPEDACALMANAIALYFSVDGFEMVLRYSEDLGWHAHSLLPS